MSAGYVALAVQDQGPEVVVIEERCPEAEASTTPRPSPEVEFEVEDELRQGRGIGERSSGEHSDVVLAALPGDSAIPAGVVIDVSLDKMWIEGAEAEGIALRDGRLEPGAVSGNQIVALAESFARGADLRKEVVLYIDHRVPGATLNDLVHTLGREGFDGLAVVVAGEAGPAAYRFSLEHTRGFVEEDEGPWSFGLSLRLGEDSTMAWALPLIDGQLRLAAPKSQPFDLGQGDCRLAGGALPRAEALAELEAELCASQAPLGVQYIIDDSRSVGELLELRALDGRTEACRGQTWIAGPKRDGDDAQRSCEGAGTVEAALASFAAAPRPGAAKGGPGVRVDGELEREVIRKIVAAHISEVRFCYNEGLKDDPELAGRVSVDFVVGEDGEVETAELGEETDVGDRRVTHCIVEAIERWRFPAPKGGGEVEIQYPFVLLPG
nr:AgmX/PglI C-terminal domain-containing protein [Pseudenhygromyxa sp. WMMC2535]